MTPWYKQIFQFRLLWTIRGHHPRAVWHPWFNNGLYGKWRHSRLLVWVVRRFAQAPESSSDNQERDGA